MARHLILGGGGFIGSHLCRRLADDGHSVWAVDINFPKFRESQWEGVEKIQADLTRYEDVVEVLYPNQQVDYIWQLAADMGGVEYFHSEHDWQAAVNNQQINVNVMQAASRYNKKARVIFTSTACALATEKQTHDSYGYHKYLEAGGIGGPTNWPLTEKDILWGTPDQLYGQEKRNSAILWAKSPLATRVAFLHTVYGPYQEYSGIRMKFPSAVAMKARRARETGQIELLGDGKQVRTYMYVDDAVDRLLALATSGEDPGFVNIGGTIPYTVDQVAVIAANAAMPGKTVGHNGYDDVWLKHIDGPTGVEARAADMTKFNRAFPELAIINDPAGLLAPDVVSLEEGMKRFIDWLDEVDP